MFFYIFELSLFIVNLIFSVIVNLSNYKYLNSNFHYLKNTSIALLGLVFGYRMSIGTSYVSARYKTLSCTEEPSIITYYLYLVLLLFSLISF